MKKVVDILKKSLTIGSAILASALVLGACGADDNDQTDKDAADNNSTPVEETETNTNETETNVDVDTEEETDKDEATNNQSTVENALDFAKLDIEIDVAGDDAIDIEYDATDIDDNEYFDHTKNIALKDAEAKTKLEEDLMDLQIPVNATNEEIIQTVLAHFNIDDYSKIEIEMKNADGSKVEIKDKK